MTDFLTRLAERSLGVGDVVRPRPASLFEPRGATVGAAPLEVEEERVVPAPRPGRGQAARPVDASPTPVRGEAPPSGEPPAAGRRDGGPAGEVRVLEGVTVEPPRAAPAPASHTADAIPRQPEPAKADEPAVDTTLVIEGLPAPAAPAGHAPARTGARPTAQRRRAAPAPPASQTPPAGPPEPGDAHAWPTMPASPMPVRVAEPAEPPVVHVTIGRVDVRAVLPATAPEQPKPRRRPRVTLEEYLRESGRR
jgi:hypothetical protein